MILFRFDGAMAAYAGALPQPSDSRYAHVYNLIS